MNCYLPWRVAFPSVGGEGHCAFLLSGPYPPFTPTFSVWISAFLATLVIEGAVLACFFRPTLRRGLAVGAVNLLTHPVAFFLWIPFAAHTLQWTTRGILLSAELSIPLIEAVGYGLLGFPRSLRTLGAAFAANFASWTLVAWLS